MVSLIVLHMAQASVSKSPNDESSSEPDIKLARAVMGRVIQLFKNDFH